MFDIEVINRYRRTIKNDQPTQEPRTIGDTNRFVIDSEGNVQWYDTLTVCLERADATIDLAISHERDSDAQPGIRPGTVTAALYGAQRELDDIRYVLHQWADAGLPEEREWDVVASGEGEASTEEQHDLKETLRALREAETRTQQVHCILTLLYRTNLSEPIDEDGRIIIDEAVIWAAHDGVISLLDDATNLQEGVISDLADMEVQP